MTDLATAIRERLDAWRTPGTVLVNPEPLTEQQYEEIKQRFLDAQKTDRVRPLPVTADERMRAALLAVLDATTPDALPPNCCACGGCLKQWILHQIADALDLHPKES